MYRTAIASTRQTLFARSFTTSVVQRKTLTDSVKETADNVRRRRVLTFIPTVIGLLTHYSLYPTRSTKR